MTKGEASGSEVQNVEYSDEIEGLSEEHRQYLLQRHGTLDLEPVPDMTDNDPYNWPKHKKVINLALVAFHAMVATFIAAAIQSAFQDIALDLDVSIQRASYLTSLVITVLGGAPLFWRPLSQRYGRRPIFMLSLVCSAVGNIGCAVCHSYATMALCRAITAFFISPAAAIGSGVVMETFFKKERARYMGIWTIMVTLGVPLAPFIFGFVALRVGYRWIYWTLAIVNGAQLVLYFFLGPETRYVRGSGEATAASTWKSQYFGFRRIDPTPLSTRDFLSPLALAALPCVAVPAVAYAMIFLWGSIVVTIETGQLFPEKFGLNAQQVGLQNISIIVGSLVGEQIGGFLSDWWMWRRHRKSVEAHPHEPEFRLWLSYSGHLLTICGIVVYLVQLDTAGSVWNVTPLIGAGIAAAGNQIVTTVMTTYAVDCHREDAAGVGVFINFVRQMWGFIGPFWFPEMIMNVGLRQTAGVATAMIVAVAMIPTALLQWKGRSWR
ncbi:major facilitator superfamily domain-containing protein [Diplogelasinospora grovesii]|uniref:Major facilitator superfamily domain-containing protein n=1 Tax=Diplogelasinospora grovesii TaxID=303347 RepID=A0AAN6N1M6_9PEZI|nr:major facilitator superfamily domain-containing protein [Diplogelasinospora grovesii]